MLWPERFEERLHIIAHGERFDVDAFLGKSTLRPDFVWRREAPVTSGVEFFLGDGRAIGLRDQENLAIVCRQDGEDINEYAEAGCTLFNMTVTGLAWNKDFE
jgi:hypothetical protein